MVRKCENGDLFSRKTTTIRDWPGLESTIHIKRSSRDAYGAVADWMYSVTGGIRPGKPGYETLTLPPIADRRIHAFKTELQTPRGRVLYGWEWDAESIQYSFLTPVEAEIRLHDTCWHVKAVAYRFLCRPNGEVVRQEQ